MLVIGIACRNKQGVQRTIPLSPYISERIHWPTGWKLQEFHIDPLLGPSICHAPWPKVNPIVHSTSYTTHIPFIPSESTLPFLSYRESKRMWVDRMLHPFLWLSTLTSAMTLTLNFHGRILKKVLSQEWDGRMTKSWLRSKLKVTKMGVTFYQLTLFSSMSIGPPIPEIQHFHNLTLKIQGQGHRWRGHWKSQHRCNILSTHIPLIPCQSAIPFLRYDFFKIWPWKSKVKIMVEVKVESHRVGVTSYHLTFFSSMSIGPSIPEIQHFQN